MLKAAWLASNTFRSGQMFVNSRTAWLAKMEGYVMLRDVRDVKPSISLTSIFIHIFLSIHF